MTQAPGRWTPPGRRVYSAVPPMGPRVVTSLLALLALGGGCAPELKPGNDRADAGRSDAAMPDGGRDAVVVDLPRDLGGGTDAPVDAPRPTGTQRSCPDAREVGCGLVEIAGGTFTMGVADPLSAVDGSPEQPRITVGPYALDAHEVTVARFRRFWAVAQGLPMVRTVSYPGGAVPVREDLAEPYSTLSLTDRSCNWTQAVGMREQHPINCIDWPTAQAFCVWDGGRLPTDAEWEFAARGREVGGLVAGRTYPWGNEDPLPTCDRARWNLYACDGDDGTETRRVDSFTPSPDLDGARIWNLSGNVYEWTADNFVPYSGAKSAGCWGAAPAGRVNPVCNVDPNGARSMRGGSWFFSTLGVMRSASRFGANPGGMIPFPGIGMRCARTR